MSTTLFYIHCVEKSRDDAYEVVEGEAYRLVKDYHREMIEFLDNSDVDKVLRNGYGNWFTEYRWADCDSLDNVNVSKTYEPDRLITELKTYRAELSWYIERLPFRYSFLTSGYATNSFEALWNDEEWSFASHWDTCMARCRTVQKEVNFSELDELPTIDCYTAEPSPSVNAGFSKAYLRYWNKEPLDEVTIKRENFLEHFSGLYEDLSAFFKMAAEEGYRICFYAVRI